MNPSKTQKLHIEINRLKAKNAQIYELITLMKIATSGDASPPVKGLIEDIEDLRASRDGWMESARHFANAADYYCGRLDEALALCGPDAYVSDDGSVQDTPIRAKAKELVESVVKERDEYKAFFDAYHEAHPIITDETPNEST